MLVCGGYVQCCCVCVCFSIVLCWLWVRCPRWLRLLVQAGCCLGLVELLHVVVFVCCLSQMSCKVLCWFSLLLGIAV